MSGKVSVEDIQTPYLYRPDVYQSRLIHQFYTDPQITRGRFLQLRAVTFTIYFHRTSSIRNHVTPSIVQISIMVIVPIIMVHSECQANKYFIRPGVLVKWRNRTRFFEDLIFIHFLLSWLSTAWTTSKDVRNYSKVVNFQY